MNKKELISAVANETGATKVETEKIIAATFNQISAALAKGDTVQMIGFGTFEVRSRAARIGKNPQTGVEIKIPACKTPAFKAGKALKDSINK